jgi:transglutaminase-like putative cysteine protease
MFRLFSGPREGWLSLLLLLIVVLSPTVSLADAAWADGLSITPWLALLAVLMGTTLAKLRVRGRIAHLFASEIGLVTIGFYFAASLPGQDWAERFWGLGYRVWVWLDAAFGGGISNDVMLFTLLMALMAWFLGYASAWLVFRRHNVWFALVACGSVLLVNLSYVPPNSLAYFLAFLLASMLLLMRVTLYKKESDWSRGDADYSHSLMWSFLWRGAILSVVIVAIAWAMPTGSVNASVAENWSYVTGPWQNLQSEFDRMFASVGASSAKAEGNRFSKTLALKGAIEMGPDIVMQVASPKPDYWATQVYDKYTGQGWMSSAPQTTRLDSNDQRLAGTNTYSGRLDMEQRFRILVGRSTSIFAASSPVKLSLPVNAEHFDSLDDLSAVRSVVPLRPGQQYAVISSVSEASADDLRAAGTDYPEWVQRYLELPPEMNEVVRAAPPGRNGYAGRGMSSLLRVTSIARRTARGTDNPYDAASALESYLRGFKYSIDVASPPPDRDAVDWFLSTSREGYCDYFASSMAVMARTLGIPSRVVTGYNTGTYNEQTGFYDVRQENAHSWPELFFPSYGWVRFEPTPSQPPSERPETTPATTEPTTDPMDNSDLQALSLDTSNRDKLLLDDSMDLTSESSSGAGDPFESPSLSQYLIAAAFLTAVALALWLVLRRRVSSLSPSEWAYLQMCAVASLLGWRLRPSQTPSEYGRLLALASPELRPDLDLVVDSYIEDTYRGRTPARASDARRSWQRLRKKLPMILLRRRFSRN